MRIIVTLSEHFLDCIFFFINEVKEVHYDPGTMTVRRFRRRGSAVLLSLFESNILADHSQHKQNKRDDRDDTA